jgi:hypothetical protein
VQVIVADGAEGAFDMGPPACIPSDSMKLSVHDNAEETFGARPPTYVPNTNHVFFGTETKFLHFHWLTQ